MNDDARAAMEAEEPRGALVLPPQTTTAVPTAVGPPGPSEWAALQGMARSIANSGLVPRALQGNVDAVTLIILTGRELSLPPVMALSHVHVVDGKPVLSAETMRALVARAGHRLRIVESSPRRALLEVQRKGEEESSRFEFTIEDAQRAKLTGKTVWQNYPQAMLLARATSAACRAYFADVLMGASYTPEEAEDFTGTTVVGEVAAAAPMPSGPRVEDIDEDALREALLAARSRTGLRAALVDVGLIDLVPGGKPVWHQQVMRDLHTADAAGNLVPVWDLVTALAKGLPDDDPTPPAPEPDDDPGPEPITPGQLVAVNAAATDRGHTAREDRLAWLSDQAGRELGTSTDLTRLEAATILNRLADEQVTESAVEADPVCPEPACPARDTHTDHLAWLAAGGMREHQAAAAAADPGVVDAVEPADRSDQGVAQAPPVGTGYAAVRAMKQQIAANHPQPSKDEDR